MKLLLCSIFLCCTFIASGQNFADKDFYLVDSLELNSVSNQDRLWMDSVLTAYHNSSDEIEKVGHLLELTEGIMDDRIWPRYNLFLNQYSWNRMFSASRSEDDRKVFINAYSTSCNNVAFFAGMKGDFDKALDYHFKTLNIEKRLNDIQGQITSNLNIGTIYYKLKNYQKANDYCVVAESLINDSTSVESKGLVYNNLAVIAFDLNDKDRAVHYHKKSLDLSLASNNVFGMAMTYNNLGGMYVDEYPDSLIVGEQYLKKAADIFVELNRYGWLSMTYEKLARTYLKLNDLTSAEKHANFALLYASKTQQIEPLYRVYKTLYLVKKEKGNSSEALFYHEKFQEMDDSLKASEVINETKMKEIQFQLEQEQILIDLENDKQLALANATQKRQRVILIAVAVVGLLILLFAIIQVKRNNKIKEQKSLLESQNEERAVLIREVHHRVKNNFQIICSVLRLQAGDENNERVSQVFEDAINRITSMSQVHDMVYRSEKFVEVDTQEYFTRLSQTHSYSAQGAKINYKIDSQVDNLSMDTIISLGLIANELITNSVKHGFHQNGKDPAIDIGLKSDADQIEFFYADNGRGFDQNELKGSFGMELIQTMSDHLQGESSFNSEQGMSFGLRFGMA